GGRQRHDRIEFAVQPALVGTPRALGQFLAPARQHKPAPAKALGDSHISKCPVKSMGCRHGPKHILTAPLVRWVEGVQAETCIFPMLANPGSAPNITCAHTLVRRRGVRSSSAFMRGAKIVSPASMAYLQSRN